MSRVTTRSMSPLQAPQEDQGAGAGSGKKLDGGYSRRRESARARAEELINAFVRGGGAKRRRRKSSLGLELVDYVNERGD